MKVHSDSVGHVMNKKRTAKDKSTIGDMRSLGLWFQLLRVTELTLLPSHSGDDVQTETVCLHVFPAADIGATHVCHHLVQSRARQISRECRRNTGEGPIIILYPCSGSHKALLIYIFIYSLYIKQWKKHP